MLDAEGMTHVDSTGADILASLVTDLRTEGVDVLIARLKGPVLETLEDVGIVDLLGVDHVHGSVRAAVEACVADLATRDMDAPMA